MSRPWFAGGTITIASVAGDGHYLRRDEGAFEDGTVDYLNLPAVTIGLRHMDRVGLDAIHRRVSCLTGWLLDALAGLCHANGRRLVQIHGPGTSRDRGGTVAFSMQDRDGRPIDDLRVEELANRVQRLAADRMLLQSGRRRGGLPTRRRTDAASGSAGPNRSHTWPFATASGTNTAGSRRPSGSPSAWPRTFADVYRFLCFLQEFVDRCGAEIERPEFAARFLASCPSVVAPRTFASGRLTMSERFTDDVLEGRTFDGTRVVAPVVNEHLVRAAAGTTMALGAVAFAYAYFEKRVLAAAGRGRPVLRRIPRPFDRRNRP